MHVSFRVDQEFESLMRDLAQREIRTKWLNEAIAMYAFREHRIDNNMNNDEIIKRLEEIKYLLLHHVEQKIEKKKEEGPEEHSVFFNILSTGINDSL